MPKHLKDKLIEDDPEYGLIDDYEGPKDAVAMFTALIVICSILGLILFIVSRYQS